MKKLLTVFVLSMHGVLVFGQADRVAILDFENISGITKYDGFGKALSNMLITDLKNSIHPRNIAFLERSQLNKILDEQNLQKSKNFDNSMAVNFGKLAGVNYVLVGSVYAMDGTCNITSRLVDVQTSEIIHAKESNGSINKWLELKSVLAQELSTAMNNPITIGAEYTEKETSEGVLAQYAKVIDKMDKGDVEGAQEMTEMLSAVQPDFKYFEDIKFDIETLKAQIDAINNKVDWLIDNPIEYVNDLLAENETNKAIEFLYNSINSLSGKDPYSLNKELFLKESLTRIYLNDNQLDSAYPLIKEMRDIDQYFMSAIVAEVQYWAKLRNQSQIDTIIQFVSENRHLFYTQELANSSRVVYNKIGPGYIIKSGYMKKKYTESMDLYIVGPDFASAVIEILSNVNVEAEFIEKYWLMSYKETFHEENLIMMLKTKPMHLLQSISNLLWNSATFNPGWGTDILSNCIVIDEYLRSLTNSQLKSILVYDGFKPKDPYFEESQYTEAFFSQWDYLNFRLNQGHLLFLMGFKEKAFDHYCYCVQNYDLQYIRSTDDLVKDSRELIKRDWKHLHIGPEEIKCKN